MAKTQIKKNQAGTPPLGTTGQVLAKNTNADFDYDWITPNQGLIQSINGDNTAAQILATSTSGNDFEIIDNGLGTHTFRLPDASDVKRGVVTTTAQTFAGIKSFLEFPLLPNSTPNTDFQAVHKQYVDLVAQGLSVRQSCKAATVANITISGEQTIDTISILSGDRVLVKNQTINKYNGIYIASAGAWTRATDYDTDGEVNAGSFTAIVEGSINANTIWVQTTQNPTLDTDSLIFTQLASAAVTNTASLGVKKIGNDFRADFVANDGIKLTANSFTVDYDNTSLGIIANKLAIKDQGVSLNKLERGTNGQLLIGQTVADSQYKTISGDATIDETGALTLANTTVTPGAYTLSNITIDSKGRITSAANGSATGGHTIQDEGSSLPQRTKLNFVGGSVAATDDAGNDATIVTITSSGGTWGTITGTLSNQTDLQSNLNALKTRSFGITLDGQSTVLSTGSKGFVTLPYAGTITNWYITGDQAGSVVVDLKRSGVSIIGAGNKPTLSSQQRANATPSSWTSVAISDNDEIEFVVDSATTVTRINLFIKVNVTLP